MPGQLTCIRSVCRMSRVDRYIRPNRQLPTQTKKVVIFLPINLNQENRINHTISFDGRLSAESIFFMKVRPG